MEDPDQFVYSPINQEQIQRVEGDRRIKSKELIPYRDQTFTKGIFYGLILFLLAFCHILRSKKVNPAFFEGISYGILIRTVILAIYMQFYTYSDLYQLIMMILLFL